MGAEKPRPEMAPADALAEDGREPFNRYRAVLEMHIRHARERLTILRTDGSYQQAEIEMIGAFQDLLVEDPNNWPMHPGAVLLMRAALSATFATAVNDTLAVIQKGPKR